jgi:VWFA-related protein
MARRIASLAAAVVFVAAAGIGAQQPATPQPPSQPPASQQPANQQPPNQQQPNQPPPDQPQQPVFRGGINFVRVDVIVTDNKTGQPVDNLKETDFEVAEDGKPQSIESFKLIKLDGGTAEAVKEPPREIRTDEDEQAEASRDDVRLFAVFLDDYHVRKGASMAVRGQLAQFVSTQIGPSDMIGVMYPLESTASVRMTRNHSAVERALQQFTGRKYDYTPKNQYEENYAYYPTETVERIRNQVSLSAIRSLIVHMGSLKEGRKTLILVSEGYSNLPPPQMRNANAQLPGLGNPDAFNPLAGENNPNEDRAQWLASVDMESDLREIYDNANRNNVAIYAVDPRGLPGFEFDINENVGIRTDTKYLTSTMDTLRVLAENTDGRAIVNRNDIAAGMKQITRDASAYYLIGYSSSQAPTDGKFHEIKVRLKRPGLQVRARKGYWALTAEQTARALAPKQDVPKPVEAALASAVARPSKAAVVRTWIGTSRGENGKTKVTFVWEPIARAPGDRVAAEEPARVSLMAVAPDGSPYFRGRIPSTTSPASNGNGAPANGGASANGNGSAVATAAAARGSRVTFDVPPGKMQLRISVEGTGSQVLDTEVREIAVPDLTPAQPLLGTPQIFRARTARDFQQIKADADAMPIATREFSRTDRLLIRIPAYGPAGAPTLAVHLLNRAGSAMAELTAAPAAKEGEQQIELPLAGLAPGEYVLEIKNGDEAKELIGFRVTG